MQCYFWGKNIDSHTYSLQEHTHSKHVKPISVYTALAGPGARLKKLTLIPTVIDLLMVQKHKTMTVVPTELQEHTHSKHVRTMSVYTELAGPGARLCTSKWT